MYGVVHHRHDRNASHGLDVIGQHQGGLALPNVGQVGRVGAARQLALNQGQNAGGVGRVNQPFA